MLRVVTFCGLSVSASWAPQRDSVAAARGTRTTRMQRGRAATVGRRLKRSCVAVQCGAVQQSGGAAGAGQSVSGYVVCRVLSCLRGARATSVDAGLQTGCSAQQQQQGQTSRRKAMQTIRVRAAGEAWWTGSRC